MSITVFTNSGYICRLPLPYTVQYLHLTPCGHWKHHFHCFRARQVGHGAPTDPRCGITFTPWSLSDLRALTFRNQVFPFEDSDKPC